jgi:hypothetical protein
MEVAMRRKSRVRIAVLTLLLAIGLIIPGATASADTPYTVVADGLHSPRGLAFGPGNILYVAQAGDGTQDGAIFQIRNAQSQHPKVRTVIDGLPTLAGENPGEYIGIGGISVLGTGHNSSLYGIMGESPVVGDSTFGELFKVDNKGAKTDVANVGAFDFGWTTTNSDLWEEFPDANPYDVLAVPGHVYVVDAGANTLDEVLPDGTVQVLAYFPNTPIRDAIPTCVAQGPDGALYVGTLALVDSVVFGPSAKVYRVDPFQANVADPTSTPMTVWADGLFPINGCTFGPDGNFYASELFTNPTVVAGPPSEATIGAAFGAIFSNPQGDVVEIPFDSPVTRTFLTGGTLNAAGGVAVAPNGDVFVADGTAYVAPGGGRVLRLDR